jgi:hypothetical protein
MHEQHLQLLAALAEQQQAGAAAAHARTESGGSTRTMKRQVLSDIRGSRARRA